ncbi:RNA polymerase II-binding domain-containing protein [Lipomyces kononenkoae]|uniref:RNA polymerase II-binding domain-containing protein n=1 Tax=Lipomyces kononenkoae TaxID=34357 RepID=A0ACC3T012_LIPKO
MSYSEDVVISKLSSVNETQEAIVNISQWVLFHRRYADQTVKTWAKALNDAPAHRKLALVYLANEVVQQSRARKREEFLKAFSPTIAEALENAYRQCSPDLQAKIRRVVDVWRQRTVFPDDVLKGIETRLDDADKKKPKQISGGRRIGQGMAFSLGLPLELSKLATAHSDVQSKVNTLGEAVASANKLYSAVTEADALPAPMEYASQIEKVLTSVNGALKASDDMLQSRHELIRQLEALLSVNKAALESETNQHGVLEEKKQKALDLQKEVSDMILGNISEPSNDDTNHDIDIDYSEDRNSPLDKEEESVVPDPVYKPLSETKPSGEKAQALSGLEGLDPALVNFLSSLGEKDGSSTPPVL